MKAVGQGRATETACPTGQGSGRRVHLPVARTAATLLCLAVTTAAQAGTVYWTMETVAASSNGVPLLAVSDIGRGQAASGTLTDAASASTKYTFQLDGISTVASGSNNVGAAAKGGSLNTSTSSYFTFTLTNNASYAMSIESLGFGSRSTGSGPTAYTIRTDANAFSSDVSGGVGSLPADSSWQYYANSFSTSLSLATGASIEFRIYGSGGSALQTVSSVNWRIDDLQVVVVPEPAALAAASIGSLIVAIASQLRRGRSHVTAGS